MCIRDRTCIIFIQVSLFKRSAISIQLSTDTESLWLSADRYSLHSAHIRRPDVLVHLQLKTDWQAVSQNPFGQLTHIERAEDRTEENCATAGDVTVSYTH